MPMLSKGNGLHPLKNLYERCFTVKVSASFSSLFSVSHNVTRVSVLHHLLKLIYVNNFEILPVPAIMLENDVTVWSVIRKAIYTRMRTPFNDEQCAHTFISTSNIVLTFLEVHEPQTLANTGHLISYSLITFFNLLTTKGPIKPPLVSKNAVSNISYDNKWKCFFPIP